MNYILITNLGILNASQRAEVISRELYCLTAPRKYQEEYQHDGKVFPVYNHPNRNIAALFVDLNYEIYKHIEADIDGYINLMGDMVNQDIRNFLETNTQFVFGDIITNYETLTEEELTNLGFFN
jgi:hypothetical protein